MGHNLLFLNHDLASEYVIFYSNEIITKGWSRDMLRHALKSKYHIAVKAEDFVAEKI